jgi:hypothetical protein
MGSMKGVRNPAGAKKRRRQCSSRHKASVKNNRDFSGFVNANRDPESKKRGNARPEGAVIRKFRIPAEDGKLQKRPLAGSKRATLRNVRRVQMREQDAKGGES